MAIILDGKKVALETREKLKDEVVSLNKKGIKVKLTVIQVGNNPSSCVYIKNKVKACENVGITCEVINFDETIEENILLNKIDELNKDKSVNGILVQLPLPEHISIKKVTNKINIKKDVDGFNIENVGLNTSFSEGLKPCTPSGIFEILNYYNIDVSGKHCVVIGRSNIVGKPLSIMLLNNNATVTICHSKTKDLKSITKEADIIFVAIGKPKFITSEYIKKNAVVIDVGISKLEDGKLSGDVDFDGVFEKCSYITPVPGGVGPMTITMLMKNTISACKIQNKIK